MASCIVLHGDLERERTLRGGKEKEKGGKERGKRVKGKLIATINGKMILLAWSLTDIEYAKGIVM